MSAARRRSARRGAGSAPGDDADDLLAHEPRVVAEPYPPPVGIAPLAQLGALSLPASGPAYPEAPPFVPYAGFASLLVRPALLTHPRRPVVLGPRGARQGLAAPALDSRCEGRYDVYAMTRHLAALPGDHLVVIALDAEGTVLAVHEQPVARDASIPPLVRLALRLPCLVWECVGVAVAHVRGGGCHDHLFYDRDVRLIRALVRAYKAAGLRLADYVIVAREGAMCSCDPETGPEGV